MTDNEIIKSMEHCCDEDAACESCLFNEKCRKGGKRLIEYALALVKHQRAEIEMKRAEIEGKNQLYEAAIAAQETLQKYMKEQIEAIFKEIEEVIDDRYNEYVFWRREYDEEQQEAIINYSDDVAGKIEQIKRKILGEDENANNDGKP